MRIKELRNEKGITQAELARELGVVESSVSLYENGKREPDLGMLKKIARSLNTTVDYLIEMTDIKEPLANESNETLSADEAELLDIYRSLIPTMKEQLLSVARVFAGNKEKSVNKFA